MVPDQDALASPKPEELLAQARHAARIGQFDPAIAAYVDYLRMEPEAVEVHAELRKTALTRRELGGGDPTPREIEEHAHGQTPLDRLLNAEYLFAKQPDHLPFAERLLRSAAGGGFRKTGVWIADMLFMANRRCRKPSVQAYLFLKEMYVAMEALDRAIKACQQALKLQPQDRQLVAQLRELTTLYHQQAPATPEARTENSPAQTNRDAALLFFAKGDKAAEAGNYDYAIEMYIDGLRRDPEALEQGHLALCRIGLRRQANGGKRPSVMERARLLMGKDPLEQLLNAEILFAKDPSSMGHAEAMLKAAVAGDFKRTAGWIANYIFQNNNASDKPSFQTYLLLKDSYKALGQFDKAVAALQWAIKLRPDKDDLAEEYKNLSAELTMANGKYDQDGDFRKSIKDARRQELLYAQDQTVKTQDWRVLAVQEARKAAAADPSQPKHLYALASALSDLETDEADEEAVQILEEAYRTSRDFGFQEKAGQFRIKHLKRRLRAAASALKAKPEAKDLQARARQLAEDLADRELEHYKACMEHYPTNRRFIYEYALRLAQRQRFDEAIPLFQEARKDPARRIVSMNQIGLCFLAKHWLSDAVDVLTQALDEHEIKDDALGKELRYNLGRSYEAKGDRDKALEIYRKIAQSDFGFRDVSDRVTQLRNPQTP